MHLARGHERAGVVPVVPDPSAPGEGTVHRVGEADGEAPDATRQRPRVLGLGDQMDVVVLY